MPYTRTIFTTRPIGLAGGIVLLLLLSNCDSLGLGDKSDEPGMGGPEPSILPVYFAEPAWHPGGAWIAAEHGDSLDTDGDGQNDTAFGGIWLVHVETGQKQPLIAGFEAPAWSADGRRLAMHGGGGIFTVDVVSLDPARIDTASLRQLTTEGSNFYPAWSPDGEWIAYDSNASDPSAPYHVWKMRSDGSEKQDITGFSSREPAWSPDGQHIVHKWYRSGRGGSRRDGHGRRERAAAHLRHARR